jgi:purine nucleosidase
VAVPVVLDTDIGTNVDDALALALAIRHPDIELRAVTTVSGATTARAELAERLLAIGGSRGVGVAVSPRDARDLLCGIAPGTTIVTVGPQSNLAAAVHHDPELAERAGPLVVMGGTFATITTIDGAELDARRDSNLVSDPAAAVVSLNAGFSTLYVPCDVTFQVALRARHLEALRRGDELCRELAQLVDEWRTHGVPPADVAAMLHDPLAVACVVDRSFVTIERMPVVVELRDGVPRTMVDDERGREADVVRSVDAGAFADWWLETVLAR